MENNDTRKEIRRILWRWGRVASTCARKQKELQGYIDLIESVSDVHSNPLTGTPGGGKVSDNTARAAEKLIFLESHYQKMIDILTEEIKAELAFQESIDKLLICVRDPARMIIDMRYKYLWSYEKIAAETSYAESTVKKLEGIAVKKIEKNIKFQKMDTF